MATEPRKAKIVKVDEYDISLQGDNTHYTAKTLEEAEKIKARVEAEEAARVAKEQKRDRVKEAIDRSIQIYPKLLARRLWDLGKNRGEYDESNPSEAAERKARHAAVKEILAEIISILQHEKEVFWHASVVDGSDYYGMQDVERDEDV